MALAFFVLSERPGPFVYAGAILTVLGTWLVSYRREGEAKWRTVDILFPSAPPYSLRVAEHSQIGLLTMSTSR